jgi:fibronectin type 3 domain-containing protein
VIRANLQPGTEYCYRIRTVDSTALPGAFSTPLVCATTPGVGVAPPAPAMVTATATSSSRINVSWSTVAAASRYYVYQSDTGPNGTFAFINTVLAPNTSLIVANLQTAAQYCFRVASNNADGTSALSAPACALTFVAGIEGYWKLNDGTGTTAQDVSGQGRNGTLVGATWTNTDRALIDNNPWAVSLSGATTSSINVTDASVWWLAGPFSLSIWTKVSTNGATRIAGKRAANCGAVNWELGQDASGNLYFAGASTINFGTNLQVGRWTHLGVTFDGTSVVLYVDGQQTATGAFTPGPRSPDPMQLGNSGGCGGGTVLVDWVQIHSRALSSAEIQTLGLRPPAPGSFTATVAGCRSVILSWGAVAGASKYFVFKGTTSGDQVFLNTVLAPNTSYTDGANNCSTQVSYYVRAATNGLISDPSTEQIVTTQAAIAAPTTVTAEAVSSSRIQVSFSAVAGATRYYVYQSQPGGGTPFAFAGTVLATNPLTYPAAGLTANTLYTYYVVTQGPDSVSAPSTTVSATTLP